MRLRSNVNLKMNSLNHTGFNCAARLEVPPGCFEKWHGRNAKWHCAGALKD
jgi:hypothetical protein